MKIRLGNTTVTAESDGGYSIYPNLSRCSWPVLSLEVFSLIPRLMLGETEETSSTKWGDVSNARCTDLCRTVGLGMSSGTLYKSTKWTPGGSPLHPRAYWFRHLSFMLDMLLFTFSTLNFQIPISVTSHATASNTNKESLIRLKSKFVNHDLIECVILNMKLISSVHFPRFCITWSVDTVTLDISLKMNGIHIIMAFPWYPHSWQCWLCSYGRLNLSRLLHTVRRTSFGWERGS
jgi:hypothetical protein